MLILYIMPYLAGLGSILARLLPQLFTKYTDEYSNETMVRGDANPFNGEDVNYADAKFYRSACFGVHQVPLNPDGENHKENAKTPNLPQRVIHVVNSYVNEAKEPQPTRFKVLSKYTLRTKGRLTKRH